MSLEANTSPSLFSRHAEPASFLSLVFRAAGLRGEAFYGINGKILNLRPLCREIGLFSRRRKLILGHLQLET
jgi:hypothetical protein